MLSVTFLNQADEDVLESDCPPYASCADPQFQASLRSLQVDKDDGIGCCLVRAARNADRAAGIALGRQMLAFIKEDPALAPRLDAILRAVMDLYAVPTDFINAILAPPAAKGIGKTKLTWIVLGAVGLLGVVGATVAIRRRRKHE